MKRKTKPDSPAPWIVFFVICALCILGASGCVFEDVSDDRVAVAACAVIFSLLCMYATRVYIENFASEPDDDISDYTSEAP